MRSVWIVAASLFIASGADAIAQTSQPAFQLRDDYQTLITEYTTAGDDVDRKRVADQIRALDASPYHEAIRQSIAFEAEAKSTRQAMGAARLINELKTSDRALVEAVLPLLDVADTEIAETADNILAGLEHRSAERRPDLSVYREILAERIRNDQPRTDALIAHMYDADAGYAMLTLMRAHQLRDPDAIKEILWAEHVVSDTLWRQRYGFLSADQADRRATRQLARLSRHEAWWARMFVAAIMRQNKSLRDDSVIETLQQDADPLVRQEATLSP